MANTQTPFQQGAAFFPGKLREILLAVDEVQQREAEEIRLPRRERPQHSGGRTAGNCAAGHCCHIPAGTARGNRDCYSASFHRAMDKLCRGYLPLAGGHRLGIAGSAVTREGEFIILGTFLLFLCALHTRFQAPPFQWPGSWWPKENEVAAV